MEAIPHAGDAIFISLTRLRLRSWLTLPAFFNSAQASIGQAQAAGGFLGGRLLLDARLTFWTVTAWDSFDAMRAYQMSGAHGAIMPKLIKWCNEASVAHWTASDAALPEWADADARMRSMGRASRLRKPSKAHATLDYPPPKLDAWRTRPI